MLPLEGFESGHDEPTRIICPPYRITQSLNDHLASSLSCPGAILLDRADNPLAGLGRLTLHIQRRPWLVPCLAVPPGEGPLDPLLHLVSELRNRLAVVHLQESSSPIPASAVLTAVRNRPAPDADVLAGWVGYRLKSRELGTALSAQFREALGGPSASTFGSAATFSRLFARYGPLTARDWRAVARLAVDRAWTDQATAPRLPFRTLLAYLKKYVRPKSRTIDRVGWEWVMESALRSGHYVEQV
jgi:hypothetical protein